MRCNDAVAGGDPGENAMSMHEFEDLVEEAVRLLAKSDLPKETLRNFYFNLFEFEGEFDTSFTHFRTMAELLAAGFVYRLALEEHPDFERAQGYFAGLSRFTFVTVPGEKADGSYVQPPHLYFDAGSALWQRLVREGRLAGPDAEAPKVLPLQRVFLELCMLAERAGDVALVSRAYRLLVWHFLQSDADTEDLKRDPDVLELRGLVRRTNALAFTFHGAALETPPQEAYEEVPLLAFWFETEPTLH
jgi:hypothetical protein